MLVVLPGYKLQGILKQLDTGYENDFFPLYTTHDGTENMIAQFTDEEDIKKNDTLILEPEVAIFIYSQVKRMGVDKVRDSYIREVKINQASYDYKGYKLHPLIKQWSTEGLLDNLEPEEIAKMSKELYNE